MIAFAPMLRALDASTARAARYAALCWGTDASRAAALSSRNTKVDP